MKLKESKKKIKEMTKLELEEKLKDISEELFNIRFQLATGHQEDFSKIKHSKRQIARIKTVLRAKELGIQ